MKTVELFAGIGGFRLAADRLGLETIWANDICRKACAVYRDNYGNDGFIEGDIHKLLGSIPNHDLLTAWFPCQPFSSAGKKKGIRDPRGTLFHSIIQVLDKHQPRFFVLENVKRLLTMEQGFHFATVLSSLAELSYRIEWRLFNTMDLGLPQNRQRVFIIGERMCSSTSSRRHPAANGVSRLASLDDLSDLRADEIADLSDPNTWKDIEDHGRRFPTWGLACCGRFIAADLPIFSEAMPTVPLRTVLQKDVPTDFDFTDSTLKWVSRNTPVNRFVQGVEILSNQRGGARMGYTIFGVNGVAPTLTSTTSRHYERYKIGNRYRRLTNVEYARIQGFPDDHCREVSVYDQYALFGNAVPPPMAQWVLDRCQAFGVSPEGIRRRSRQRTLFEYAH